MTKNVLLTGGFGTLGGRLAAILAQDEKINLRLASRVKRISPTWAPQAETFVVDFDNSGSVRDMLSDITHVVHLVAMTDFESRAEPDKAQQVNVEYTRRVVEQCAKKTRFINLSTIQVYGANLSGTITESTDTNPADAYSQTHLDAEQIVESAHNAGVLEGVSLRNANGFGAPMSADAYSQTHLDAEQIIQLSHDAGLIEGVSLRNANGFGAPMSADAKIWQIIANDLCRQAVEKKQLTLKSHGLQYRNFIPFTDVCTAIRHCLFMPSEQTKSPTFNLGRESTIRVLDMAELIAMRCSATLGYKPELNVLGASPESLPTKFAYDSRKLRSTGLSLTTRFEDEIDGLLAACQKWFKSSQ